ncbi:MAG TPA: hypothetical protein VJ673_12225 [Aromatoleum sp.]|uniref:hypothetical protein n=1 Tax=Aromatoleum sp. TaxID=2307007 RepID=UPI002B473EC9|nr:hypothetical protein [Aromatoleum sp.]HJV26446.1 hypothetical protein [Aromatoleum sp.]
MNIALRLTLSIALAWATVLPASAQVFKCSQPDGRIAYQDGACSGRPDKQPLDLDVHQPSLAEQDAAEKRALDEARFVREVESGREYSRRLAQIESDARKRAEERQDERCAEYQRRAEYLESRAYTWYTRRYYRLDMGEARGLRDRYFTECVGRRKPLHTLRQ